MGLIDDLRLRGATSRVTEEALYAEALREVESGLRRDGLWAMALAQSGMRQSEAQATYLKLRVQSLRDEIDLLTQLSESPVRDERELSKKASNPHLIVDAAAKSFRERPVKGVGDWFNVVIGLGAIFGVVVLVLALFSSLGNKT